MSDFDLDQEIRANGMIALRHSDAVQACALAPHGMRQGRGKEPEALCRSLGREAEGTGSDWADMFVDAAGIGAICASAAIIAESGEVSLPAGAAGFQSFAAPGGPLP